ncbi:filamentous hemagglutinin N-terminal domain-containing protein [Tropicimonas sp. TH_r6]|uniref:two-partner secretion domain-containing protein n=1 Tax=Tropicimonas sp. TH_r6 TaxID=3082085 RepID=UPI0029558710|nr:filamentous hemagglutinin N-terminal domain-containing protein [Tropicimonas sp. TH_r6]MDV7143998.1 filamentous hemagglutinin N-terminal domain-containing protein [Tropicimonas sp. TH_r6]
MLWTSTALAQSLPTGGSVAAGDAVISQSSSTRMTINQSSDSAVVNWDGFSIGTDARLDFRQPSSQSAILNRVTGSATSEILGQLSANGQVHLVNPNGIYIGPSGMISASGFVASTLDISDDDFMNGALRYRGNGTSNSVENAGTISIVPGGYAALIGGRVSNSGLIRVPLGKVGLGAGEEVTLDISGDGFLQVAVPSDTADDTMEALVSNSGRIEADGGIVHLKAASARDAARRVVNMSGVIEARSVGGVSGAVVLGGSGGVVTVTGKIDTSARVALVESSPRPAARPENGGSITITGEAIGLAGATLDASGTGSGSGGDIRVGGEFQGGGDLQTSWITTVDADTRIISDGGNEGDGGTVIVWSDEYTSFAGQISSRGGADGGDGGLVEVSGKAKLAFAGLVDTQAPNGETGTLLLDPYNIIIDDIPPEDPFFIETTSDGDTYYAETEGADPANDGSILLASTITDQLELSNVIVTTNDTEVPGSQPGNITVDADVTWSTPQSLTLVADNNIVLRTGDITSTGAGDAILTAGGFIDTSSDISTNTGDITMTAGDYIQTSGSISTNSGDVTMTATDFIRTSGDITIGTGSLRLSPSGDLTVNGDISAGTGATIDLATAGTTIVTGDIIAPDAATLFLSGDTGLSVTGTTIEADGADLEFTSADGSVLVTSDIEAAEADIVFDAESTLETRGVITAPESTIAFNSGGDITVSGAISAPDTDAGSTASIDFTARAGSIRLDAPIFAPDGELTFVAAGGSDPSSPILAGASADIDVATFILSIGDWQQVGSSPADFSADDFQLGFEPDRRSFLRALGGDGSTGSPYQLFDIFGVQGVDSESLSTLNFGLANDIDASGTTGWNDGDGFFPIEVFYGTLDGNRHAIDGLFLDGFSYGGLFGIIFGTVQDLSITNANVSSFIGGILAAENFGTVSGVRTTGSFSAFEGTGGGLVGFNDGVISQSYSTADVFVEVGEGSVVEAGGLVGVNYGLIEQSHSTGSVEAIVNGTIYGGGLVGRNFGEIEDAYSMSDVSGTNFATSGETILGGLVGSNDDDGEGRVGSIARTFSTGELTASGGAFETLGGLIGENLGTVEDSFWDFESSGQGTSAGGAPLTTAEFQDTQFMYDLAIDLGWISSTSTDVWAPGGSGFYPALMATSPVVFAIPDDLTVSESDVPTASTTGTVYGGPSIYRFYRDPDSLDTSPIFATLAFDSDAVGTTGFSVDTSGLSSASGMPYRVVALEGTATVTPDPVEPPVEPPDVEEPEETIILPVPLPKIEITPTIDTTISGGGTLVIPVSQARAALQTLDDANTSFEQRITDCASQGEDVSQYLSCLADATEDFADSLEAISEGLPPEMDNVANIIRDASSGLRAVGEDAGRKLALATTVVERAAIRREAGLQARTILRGAQQEIRKEISLIRAEDPELASVQRQQVETVVAAVEKAEIGLSRAIGL